jgi:hypothetical protein
MKIKFQDRSGERLNTLMQNEMGSHPSEALSVNVMV